MSDQYTKYVMDVVDRHCPLADNAVFWHWLANERFKEDDGDLTQERAIEIAHDVKELYAEFKAGRWFMAAGRLYQSDD